MIRRWSVRGSSPAARIAVVAAATVLLVGGCRPVPSSHPTVGRAVGPLPIVSIHDATTAPPDVAGRVTLLNFWGTWCPPCRRELPGLVRLAARLAGEPAFQLIAVSCGAGAEDVAEVTAETRAFLTERGLEVGAWAFVDAAARRDVSERLGLDAFPTTYLVGPDGRVRRVWRGYRPSDEPEIARAVLEVLKERAAASVAAMRSRKARAAAAGAGAAVIAEATANRRIPSTASSSTRSSVMPPMAKAGSGISATTALRKAGAAKAANDFVADG
jgi:thiol-disulfide isomerase/thioredoxin